MTRRDYRAEYLRRVARAEARGLSRAQARGHPKPDEPAIRQLDVKRTRRHARKAARGTATAVRPARTHRKPAQPYSRQLEAGLQELRAGKSLTASARAVHVAPERLRRYAAHSPAIGHKGDRWIARPDRRRREMLVFSRGEAIVVIVRPPTDSIIGDYMSEVGHFLESNNAAYLAPFRGRSFTDAAGKRHAFETDPNALYELADTDSATFEDVYRVVA